MAGTQRKCWQGEPRLDWQQRLLELELLSLELEQQQELELEQLELGLEQQLELELVTVWEPQGRPLLEQCLGC
jgi:hypothetical protein